MAYKCEVCGKPTPYVFVTHTVKMNETGMVVNLESPPRYFCEEHQPHKGDWLKDIKITIDTTKET